MSVICLLHKTSSIPQSTASAQSRKKYAQLLRSLPVSISHESHSVISFFLGNIAVGNLHHFLPVIVKMIEQDAAKRLLSLHALKEVVTHCSHVQLETVAEVLWVPLFQNSEDSEEITRNVAAACLGKLATTAPSRYLPQLQARVHDASPAARATVISAIRYTFAEPSRSYDELLSTYIMEFLSLISDSDLVSLHEIDEPYENADWTL